jgi:exopolyphosphatase/guanosine-5'-triphosphate,3'-diphosphate pyrophosphatase
MRDMHPGPTSLSTQAHQDPLPAPGTDWHGVLAAIDIGSNTIRLEIARHDAGHYQNVDYLKETARLGAGLDAQHRLVGAPAERGLACLGRFGQRLAGMPAAQVRAVATQTLREASNRDEFLRSASQALGYPIEVISGHEEARLIYLGVARLQPGDKRRLVVDIGGRSTEIILGQGAAIFAAESFGVGSVSLSRRHFADGVFSRATFDAARAQARAAFAPARHLFPRAAWQEALGSSGSASAVSQLLRANGRGDGAITPQALDWCLQCCLAAGSASQLHLPGLEPDRAPIIGGGLAVLLALLDLFEIDCLQPAKGALRNGLVFDLLDRQGGA